MKSKKKNDDGVLVEISSSFPVSGLPDTAFEMINEFGTYEIQKTTDTSNQYPAIAQGYNSAIIKHDCENPADHTERKTK